jgi:hypothetical protein
MPKYFFHIRHGWDVIPDEEGMAFPDLAAAGVEAYASADDLAAAALASGRRIEACAIEVANEAGCILHRVKVQPIRRAG